MRRRRSSSAACGIWTLNGRIDESSAAWPVTAEPGGVWAWATAAKIVMSMASPAIIAHAGNIVLLLVAIAAEVIGVATQVLGGTVSVSNPSKRSPVATRL